MYMYMYMYTFKLLHVHVRTLYMCSGELELLAVGRLRVVNVKSCVATLCSLPTNPLKVV